MIERQVQTIFCDDIRHEISGKVSYIGVYSEKLLVERLPVILPKLCIAVKVLSSIDKPFKNLELNIYQGDDKVIYSSKIDEKQLVQVFNKPVNDIDNGVQIAQLQLILTPLKLDAECKIKVEVKTEEGIISGLGLEVLKISSLKKTNH